MELSVIVQAEVVPSTPVAFWTIDPKLVFVQVVVKALDCRARLVAAGSSKIPLPTPPGKSYRIVLFPAVEKIPDELKYVPFDDLVSVGRLGRVPDPAMKFH